MNFKEFTTILKEARFRETPSDLIRQVKKLALKYVNEYNSLNGDSAIKKLIKSGKILDFSKNKGWRFYFDAFLKDPNDPTPVEMPSYFAPEFGVLNVVDLESGEKKQVKVMCVYGDITTDWAAYNEGYESINLYDENMKELPLSLVESKILHEATHAFQQYKATSKKYEKASRSNFEDEGAYKVYYEEPIEYDTHLNEIVYNIREKFKMLLNGVKKAKEDATKKVLQKRLDLFLTELRIFTKASPDVYFDIEELTLPSELKHFENFLSSIKDEPKLWNKFKLKMVLLYKELSGETLS